MIENPAVNRDGVAGVILNYRSYLSTLRCLEALVRNPEIARVDLIDNASPDGSGTDLARHFHRGAFTLRPDPAHSHPSEGELIGVLAGPAGPIEVVLTRSPVNLGYGGGNNLGLRRARRAGFSHALVLNPDVVIDENAVGRLLARCASPVALVGPSIWEDARRTRLECVGGAGYVAWSSTRRPARSAEEARGISFVSGACFLVDLKALDSVDWLCEDHFLYYEELDLAKRLTRRGFSLGVASDADVVHERGQSIGSSADLSLQSPLSSYFGSRSALLFTRKWYPQLLPAVLIIRLGRALLIALRSPRRALVVARGTLSGARGRPIAQRPPYLPR